MKKSARKLLSLTLALVLLLGLMAPAMATDSGNTASGNGVSWEKIENGSRMIPLRKDAPAPLSAGYADTDVVRVSIVLEDASALGAGYSSKNVASAQGYRAGLEARQDRVADAISARALGGRPLDVVWNLTLAANLISANVPYGKIEAIKAVSGVKDVVVEERYSPAVYSKDEYASPNMSTSGAMIQSTAAWASGYTGAGSKIAIIDTGLDTEHETFDAGAFLYSVGEDAALYTVQDYSGLWSTLHIAKSTGGDAADAYLNEKVPFAANYVDRDFDVSHVNDSQGEHGSHVAGIAAANKYVPDGAGGYAEALESVLMQGVAPDAQVMVMKVFGKTGGAYPSDYFAALEDAIALGADAVNLSLGSSSAGFAADHIYDAYLDEVTKSGTVVSISMGNSGAFGDETPTGTIYAEDASFYTGGSPGSYASSFTVASIDNVGITGTPLKVDGHSVFFTETSGLMSQPMSSLAPNGDTEYDFVYLDCTGDATTLFKLGDLFRGKILLVNRGVSSFADKANYASWATDGEVLAVIVVNNEPGLINMQLDEYYEAAPAIFISQEDGEYFKTNPSVEMVFNPITEDMDMLNVYSGKVTVSAEASVMMDDPDTRVMSDFSSWGMPGDLSLKPEITAPGGNIYSLAGKHSAGGGHDKYESMSGTSMAAPQITGLSALMSQYIRENNLEAKTGLSARQLTQSLLMSTAEVLTEAESGSYYSVLSQGAGLANVAAAMSAKSYLLMGEDATPSAGDGKVKVELHDDPERTGEYSFSFTVNNFSDESATYELDAEFFTQDITYDEALDTQLLEKTTVPLSATTTFTVNGSADHAVTVAPGQSAEVVANVKLLDIKNYDVNGAYVEGYVFLYELPGDEGVAPEEHSIPVLGFYGSWAEPGSTDIGSYYDYLSGKETRPSYVSATFTSADTFETFTYAVSGEVGSQNFGGNPYQLDDTYMPERNAMNSANLIDSLNFIPIRNIAGYRFVVTDEEGNEVHKVQNDSRFPGAVYNPEFYGYDGLFGLGLTYSPKDAEEGDQRTIRFYVAPEYYADENDVVDWTVLDAQDRPEMEVSFTVDNTAPEILDIVPAEDGSGLTVTVKDNGYIAALLLQNEIAYKKPAETPAPAVPSFPGMEPEPTPAEPDPAFEATYYPGEVAKKGEALEYFFEIDLNDENNLHLYLATGDYAANETDYKLNLNPDEDTSKVTSITLEQETVYLAVGSTATVATETEPWGSSGTMIWSSADPAIAEVDAETGVITGAGVGQTTVTVAVEDDPTVTATVKVIVDLVDYDLGGLLWDENGQVWPIRFNTQTIPEYKTLSEEPFDYAMIGMVDKDDVTYVSDGFDLFTLDWETMELTEVGELGLGGLDNLKYTTLTDGFASFAYGYYLVLLDLEGNYEMLTSLMLPELVGAEAADAAWDKSEVTQNEDGGEVRSDYYYIVNSKGDLYYGSFSVDMDLYEMTGSYNIATTASFEKLGNIGGELDFTAYRYQDLYKTQDGRIFWSRFDRSTNVSEIRAIALIDGETFSASLGDFGPSIWPIKALRELPPEEEPEPETPTPVPQPIVRPSAPVTTPDPVEPEPFPFEDVTEEDWFYTEVKEAYEAGLMEGISEDTFAPRAEGSRAQIVTVLWRLAGEPGADSAAPFADVSEDAYYSAAVAWAAENGIVLGVTEDTFRPDRSITREELAVIVYRFAVSQNLGEGAAELSFEDTDQISDWALEAIQWAVANGILNGKTGNILDPKGTATRAEVAAIFNRYHKLAD